MKRKIKYANRVLEIEPYTIKTEKDLIFYALGDDPKLDEILYILKDYYKLYINNKLSEPQSEEEKIYICFLLREISVSESLNYKFSCDNIIDDKRCSHPIDTLISISDTFKESTFDPKLLKKYRIKDVLSSNIQDYFIDDISTIDCDKFDEICDYIEKHCAKFDFVRDIKCNKCHKIHKVSFYNIDTLVKSFSEVNIQTLYKLINQLIYKGNYDLNSILNFMYPYEREIYIDNLNQEIEEINKSKSKSSLNY